MANFSKGMGKKIKELYEKVNNEWKFMRHGGNMGTFEMTIKDNSPITADLDNF